MRKYLLVACLLLMNTGCAKMEADRAARGGLLGHYNGDYIVRNDSGGVIMDVWVLEDRLVQNEDKSDGWYFVDNDGNVIHLGGGCQSDPSEGQVVAKEVPRIPSRAGQSALRASPLNHHAQ